ncbi:MAG: type I-C CRISPR-associated protein Cas8c/Csd1, partial [Firmicutes bacterium]|nr:type I-C CRISPR-associated protein Cas8c/Csd1 [Bacillota bacterium]
MILQALTRYYEDLAQQGKIARPGWAKTKINYALCIDESGKLEQVIPLLDNIGGKKPVPQKFDLPAPVKRTVGISPNFLWDNSAYLIGIDSKGNQERSRACFEESKNLHHRLLDGIDVPEAKGIRNFYDKWDPSEASSNGALKSEFDSVISGGNLTFRVNGIYAFQVDAIAKAWQEYYESSDGLVVGQCLVTGEEDVIEPVHPSIKGVDGAQSSGAAIVSFNSPAFCSYGQEQNYNAPIGKHAAFAYTSALNYLLSDRENVQKIGDTTVVCWAEGAEKQYQVLTAAALFGKDIEGLSEDDVRDAVRKLANGLPVPERELKPDRPFYIL